MKSAQNVCQSCDISHLLGISLMISALLRHTAPSHLQLICPETTSGLDDSTFLVEDHNNYIDQPHALRFLKPQHTRPSKPPPQKPNLLETLI